MFAVQRCGKQWLHLSCWATRINCERAFSWQTRRMWNIQQQAADALQCRVASLSRTLFRLATPPLSAPPRVTLLPRAVCNYNETMHLPLVLPAALVLLVLVLILVVVAPVLLRAFCAGAVGRGLPSYRYLCCPDNYQLIAIRGGERQEERVGVAAARQPNPQLIQLQRHLAR